MKKLIITLLIASISFNAFSQSCEERIDKMLYAVGSFSAAAFYNTYATIGSISDGYMKDAYKEEIVEDLMTAQKKVTDNLIKVMNGLLTDSTLKTKTDRDYAVASVSILEGLKKQAQLLSEYVSTKSQRKQEAYEDQRNRNWSAISKLMGIKE